MRLMEAEGAGSKALVCVCLYCGAQTEPRSLNEVMYCYCRSTIVEYAAMGGDPRAAAPLVRRAA